MSLQLPSAPPVYDRADQAAVRLLLQAFARTRLGRGDDLDSGRIVRVSPDGSRWALGVSDAGESVWTRLP